jgi:SPRY domain-containing SOCS box protein 1/4
VGSTVDSYGWDLSEFPLTNSQQILPSFVSVRNVCLHDSKNTKNWSYPNPDLVGERFSAPEKIFCILDMDEGSLAFATEHTYLGVAFRNLRGQTLYPVVCAVWGHCEITLKFVGSFARKPLQQFSSSKL